MTIRPYASTGIALVSAGVLVAALPTITPAPTPPDVSISAQIPKDVYADVALRLSAHDLVHAFFATGVPGVTQQILLAIAGGYQPGVDTINGFFEGNPDSDFEYPGIPEVLRQILVADAGPVQKVLINGFFLDGGLPDVVRQILVANAGPDQVPFINGFFNGNPDSDFEYPGIPEPVRLLIQGAIPDGSLAETLVDAFFLDGGVPEVTRQLLLAGLPAGSAAAGLVNAFFDSGVPGVVQAVLPSNALTQAFFAGGAPLVTEAVLLGVSNAIFGGTESPASEAIRSFFEGYPPPDAVGGQRGPLGVPGLTHFIIDRLMGVVIPEPTPPPAPVAPAAKTLLAAASDPSATAAELPKASDPIDTNAPSVTLSIASPVNTKSPDPKPVAAESDPAPTAAVASTSDPAPAATPAVEPTAATPRDEGGKADDATNVIKSGNKAEVDPLLLENGGGGASLAKTVKSFRDFIHKLRGGGATDSAKADSTKEGTGES